MPQIYQNIVPTNCHECSLRTQLWVTITTADTTPSLDINDHDLSQNNDCMRFQRRLALYFNDYELQP